MDLAYDHVQEAVIIDQGDVNRKQPSTTDASSSSSASASAASNQANQQGQGLNAEFTEAYQAFSNSPWGMRLGGFLGAVRKQVCLHFHREEIGWELMGMGTGRSLRRSRQEIGDYRTGTEGFH